MAALLLALLSSARPARAESSATVLLTVAAEANDAEALRAVASELLERLSFEVELRRVERIELQEIRQRPPSGMRYYARVWVGFAQNGRARLYLEHTASDRVLVRDVNDDGHNPELVREELGHILQSALEGLKAGEQIGAPRREALRAAGDEAETPARAVPASKAAPPASPSAELRPRTWRFGPRYELSWLGDGSHFEDGPGAVFGLAVPGAPRFGVELGGYFRRPVRIETTPIGARLQSWGLLALASLDAWRGTSARLRLAAGIEGAFVRVSPFAQSGQSATLASNRWLKLALGRFVVTYAHDLGSRMDLELSLGALLDASGTRYIAESDQGEVRVLSPWPVRPLAAVGVTVP